MAAPPFSICVATRSAVSGARLSRSGPTLPDVPASLSVWQPPQVAVKAALPAATSAPEPPPVVVALDSPPDRRRSARRSSAVELVLAASVTGAVRLSPGSPSARSSPGRS